MLPLARVRESRPGGSARCDGRCRLPLARVRESRRIHSVRRRRFLLVASRARARVATAVTNPFGAGKGVASRARARVATAHATYRVLPFPTRDGTSR